MFFVHVGSNDYKCINRLKRTGKLILTSPNRQMLPGVCLPTKFQLDLTGIFTEKGRCRIASPAIKPPSKTTPKPNSNNSVLD